MKYRLLYLMIIVVLLFTVDGLGQNTWVKTFGGSDYDMGYSITTTSDGGFILTGSTGSNDGDFSGVDNTNSDIFVIKLNTNGDTVWKKRYWGIDYDEGYSITTSKDGGYILTGNRGVGGGDILVMKLNSSGDIVWKKVFGGRKEVDIGNSIITTNDGGYILTGYTSSNDGDFSGMNKGGVDIFVLKLNSDGDIIWKKTFGGSIGGRGKSITNTNDGGYILTGYISSNDGDFSGMNKGGDDIFVLKLNHNGNVVWKKTFGGSGGDEGKSITNTNDGGYILTGYTSSNDGDFSGMNKGEIDIFIMKINSSGDLVWKRTFGGSIIEYSSSITTTSDGEYVLTGHTFSNDGDFYRLGKGDDDYSVIFVMKLNLNGDLVWKKTFGGSSGEGGYSITTTNDGGFVLTGSTSSNDGDFYRLGKGDDDDCDIFVMKLDKNGNLNKK